MTSTVHSERADTLLGARQRVDVYARIPLVDEDALVFSIDREFLSHALNHQELCRTHGLFEIHTKAPAMTVHGLAVDGTPIVRKPKDPIWRLVATADSFAFSVTDGNGVEARTDSVNFDRLFELLSIDDLNAEASPAKSAGWFEWYGGCLLLSGDLDHLQDTVESCVPHVEARENELKMARVIESRKAQGDGNTALASNRRKPGI